MTRGSRISLNKFFQEAKQLWGKDYEKQCFWKQSDETLWRVCLKIALIWLAKTRTSEAALPLPGQNPVIQRQLWRQHSSISQIILDRTIYKFPFFFFFFLYIQWFVVKIWGEEFPDTLLDLKDGGGGWTFICNENPMDPSVTQVKVQVSVLSVRFFNFLKCCTTFIHLFNDSWSLGAYRGTQGTDTNQSLTPWEVRELIHICV